MSQLCKCFCEGRLSTVMLTGVTFFVTHSQVFRLVSECHTSAQMYGLRKKTMDPVMLFALIAHQTPNLIPCNFRPCVNMRANQVCRETERVCFYLTRLYSI